MRYRDALASATVKAVIFTIRRTVVLAVRMCTGCAAPSSTGPMAMLPPGGLEQVVGDVGRVDVGQHQQVGIANQVAVGHERRAGLAVQRHVAVHLAIHFQPGACTRSSSSVWRILTALGWLLEPKLECDSSAALGLIPKRIISSAAITVISASCSAVGS